MARDGLSVVEKAALILQRFLDERSAALGFNEILAGIPLSKATAHRLLTDLTEQGFLSQDSQRDRYRLGPLLLSAGLLAQNAAGIADTALPRMQKLRDRFGETIVLSELHGDSVVPVRRLDGLHEMRMNQELGRRYPAFAGATGQVLLAHTPESDLEAYLRRVNLEELTAATYTDVDELREILDLIRTAGVGISRGQRVAEAIAIAAPVFAEDGRLVAALTISGLASRWDHDRLFEAAIAVKEAADEVSRQLGYVAPSTAPRAADLAQPDSKPAQSLERLCDDVWERGVVRQT
jgi:DNA-binding IclR family transcriptional regulator